MQKYCNNTTVSLCYHITAKPILVKFDKEIVCSSHDEIRIVVVINFCFAEAIKKWSIRSCRAVNMWVIVDTFYNTLGVTVTVHVWRGRWPIIQSLMTAYDSVTTYRECYTIGLDWFKWFLCVQASFVCLFTLWLRSCYVFSLSYLT